MDALADAGCAATAAAVAGAAVAVVGTGAAVVGAAPVLLGVPARWCRAVTSEAADWPRTSGAIAACCGSTTGCCFAAGCWGGGGKRAAGDWSAACPCCCLGSPAPAASAPAAATPSLTVCRLSGTTSACGGKVRGCGCEKAKACISGSWRQIPTRRGFGLSSTSPCGVQQADILPACSHDVVPSPARAPTRAGLARESLI